MSKDSYQLSRVLENIRNGCPEPLFSADRIQHSRSREQFGIHATTPRSKQEIVSYVPFFAFERTNADLGSARRLG